MCALLKPMMELLIMRPTQKTCGGSTAAGSKMRAMKNILKEKPKPETGMFRFLFRYPKLNVFHELSRDL